MKKFLAYLISFSLYHTGSCQHVPIVKTTSGLLRGFSPIPNVIAYLGIPFAQPPVGDLRFAPPQALKVGNSSAIRDCYHSSPGCFQLGVITAFLDRATGIAESEDMLSINLWKPAESVNKTLPVMIFLYGGGFSEGANGMPAYNGAEFVAEQKDIIYITINYRINVFGFPNSPAIETKNPGLLDQRLAVEWLRDNIASFGGDPERMTLAGHSAGSISIAYWSYAYVEDPIVSGLIEWSGQPGLIPNDDGTNWPELANSTGCLNSNSVVELECMRALPPRSIKNGLFPSGLAQLTDPMNPGGTPVVDNITVFSLAEYKTRGEKGEFAKLPLVVSNTLNEADGVLPFSPTDGINTTLSDLLTMASFQCPVSSTARYNSQQNLPTWRYLYNGSFSEVKPYPWMRPYHGSDSALMLNQVSFFAYEDLGPEVVKAGVYLRNAMASFARDPVEGLTNFGWPRYDAGAPTLVKLFGENSIEVAFENPADYDAPCQYIT